MQTSFLPSKFSAHQPTCEYASSVVGILSQAVPGLLAVSYCIVLTTDSQLSLSSNMADIVSYQFSSIAHGIMDSRSSPATSYAESNLEVATTYVGTGTAPCCSASAASSSMPLSLSIEILNATSQDVTEWHSACFEIFSRNTLFRLRALYRTYPEHGNGSASSGQSTQLSLGFSVTTTGCGSDPPGKRRGDNRSEGRDNRPFKRPRIVKKTPEGPRMAVICPFKVRHPDHPDFESCPAFKEWHHLRQHMLQRKHRPMDQCHNCGEVFDDDVEWDQHTTIGCDTEPREFEEYICVERGMVAPIRELTSRGYRSKPMDELFCESWPILFGQNVPIPDRSRWVRVAWSNELGTQGSVLPAPARVQQPFLASEGHSEGSPSDLAMLGVHNMPPPGTLDLLQPSSVAHESALGDTIDPRLLQYADVQPVQSLEFLNNISAAPANPTLTALPSASPEPNASVAASLGSSSARSSWEHRTWEQNSVGSWEFVNEGPLQNGNNLHNGGNLHGFDNDALLGFGEGPNPNNTPNFDLGGT